MSKKLLFRLVALVAAMMCALGMQAAEAYANYTPSNKTLTFYYDNNRSSRSGTTYDLPTGTNIPDWYGEDVYGNLNQVVFNSSFANARPTTTHAWFYGMKYLVSIKGMEYLNTSEVTDMSYMFGGCQRLTTIDVSRFNTIKVTNMKYMFCWCYSLQYIDMSSFNTSNVTNMEAMFGACFDLETIYSGNAWSTAAVPSSEDIFGGCTSLVGGQGTTYDANHVDKAYAHIDGGPSNPGYFTSINSTMAYACYTPSNTTLTFYYDNYRASRTGTTYDLNTGDKDPGWYSAGSYADVTKVVFNSSFANARPTSTCAWFYQMANLQSVTGMAYLNTSEVTDMSWMFSGSSLTNVDLSHFNTSKVTRMDKMFNECSNLTSLDLSSFNTSKVTDMGSMFINCNNLKTIYVGDGWSTAAVTVSGYMFSGCKNIVGGLGTIYDASHVDKAYAHIDGGTSNPGYFTAEGAEPWGIEAYANYTPSNTTLTFYYDNQRSTRTGTTYDLNTGNNDPGWYSDGSCANVTKVVFNSSFANACPTSTYYWFGEMENLESITGMQYLNTSQVTDMGYMFAGCSSLTALDVSHFDTHNVTNMNSMFNGCCDVTVLDVSGFDTRNVTNMYGMFIGCSSVTTLDVSGFDTRNVTNMHYMFYNCNNVTTLDLSGFDTQNVTGMSFMFDYCYALTNLDLSGFNTAQVADMRDMFQFCRGLTSLDLSGFNTSQVTNMSGMFWGCNNLTSLDLSGFNTSQVTSMSGMFYNCSKLQTIYAGDEWSTAAVTSSSNMFKNCTSLVGGQGTTFDANHIDKEYAHIDGGPANPGYFTALSFDEVLNVEGGNIHFETGGDYPWVLAVDEDGTVCARSSNAGVPNSASTLTATVTVTVPGTSVITTFKARGESSSSGIYDACTFKVDGNQVFSFGSNLGNYWTTNNSTLEVGTHTLTWTYSKDSSVDPDGDFFAIRQVYLDIPTSMLGDVNGDGRVDVSDVTALISKVLGNEVSPFNAANADMNGDNRLDVSDVTALIAMVLNS